MMHCTSLHLLKMFILYSTVYQVSKHAMVMGNGNYLIMEKKKSSKVIMQLIFVVDIF